MYREVKHGDEARQVLKKGIDDIADTVKVTLGAKGRNVVLDRDQFSPPLITNDGVTIAREMTFKDEWANAGAKQIREVANKTNDVAGDGTTTAAVLMQAIINEGMRAINAGDDPLVIRAGIESATRVVVSNIKAEAKTATDESMVESTAVISSGSEELGKLVASAVNKLGADAIIALEDNSEPKTELEYLEGLKLKGGFNYPLFITSPESQQAIFNNVLVLVTNQAITMGNEMTRIMEAAVSAGKKECIIIASSIEADAMTTAMMNWVKGQFRALPIRVATYGDAGEGAVRDIAAITGATFVDGQVGLKIAEITAESFGTAAKVVVSKHETTIVAKDKEAQDDRAKELKAQLKDAREYEAESIRERIAKLTTGMATIKVGGMTDTELQERKLRVEDAVNAAKAALSDGVIAGGGTALLRATAKENAKPNNIGEQILYRSCSVPFSIMAHNAGYVMDGDVMKALTDPDNAIDFRDGTIKNAFEAGVIDPVLVVTSALENAASGAAMFLTTESAVITKEVKQNQ